MATLSNWNLSYPSGMANTGTEDLDTMLLALLPHMIDLPCPAPVVPMTTNRYEPSSVIGGTTSVNNPATQVVLICKEGNSSSSFSFHSTINISAFNTDESSSSSLKTVDFVV